MDNYQDLSHLFNTPKDDRQRFADYYGEQGVEKLVKAFNDLMESTGGFIMIGTPDRVIDAYLGISKDQVEYITNKLIERAESMGILAEEAKEDGVG